MPDKKVKKEAVKKETKEKKETIKKPRVKKAEKPAVKVRAVKKEKPPKEEIAEIIQAPAEAKEAVEAVSDEKRKPGFLQAVGRRKEAVARVKMFKNGKGGATVNGKDIKEYFGSNVLVDMALGALDNVSQLNKIDISAKVSGGGKKGQAEAIRLGTARALLQLNPIFRKNLRKAGFLTRDPRMKERKKFGLKKARRAPQWAKR